MLSWQHLAVALVLAPSSGASLVRVAHETSLFRVPTTRPVAARARVACLTASDSPVPPADRTGRIWLTVLSSAGAIETGLLSADKLFGTDALNGLCSATGGSCADVLSGPWSTVFGIPLSVFGLAAYTLMAALAAAPLIVPYDSDETPGTSVLVFGSGALAAFSSCLMLLLLLVLREPCTLCFASAAISVGWVPRGSHTHSRPHELARGYFRCAIASLAARRTTTARAAAHPTALLLPPCYPHAPKAHSPAS